MVSARTYSEDAAPLFNYLNEERRYVAAVLYPPRELPIGGWQALRNRFIAAGGLDAVTSFGVLRYHKSS
jgi:hypothetical protein